MTKYKNLSKISGVLEFKRKRAGIDVTFITTPATTYTYREKYSGKDNIDKMKILAGDGIKLNRFINKTKEVRLKFEKK
jgi:hypothetical protein